MAHGVKNVVDFVAAYQWSMEQREGWGDRPETVMTCQLFCGQGKQACGSVGDCSCGQACVAVTLEPESATTEAPETVMTRAPIQESPEEPETSTTKESESANESEGGEDAGGHASKGDENQGPGATTKEPEPNPEQIDEAQPGSGEMTMSTTSETMAIDVPDGRAIKEPAHQPTVAPESPEPSTTVGPELRNGAEGDKRGEDENGHAIEGDSEDRGLESEKPGTPPEKPDSSPEPSPELMPPEEPEPSTVVPTATPKPTKLVGRKQKCTSGKIRFHRRVGDHTRCLVMCEAEPACKFFTSYRRGGCVTWSRCDRVRYSRAGTTYSRT